MEKFGLREVCDVYLIDLKTNKPVLYLDTLKVSTLENAGTTTYATGGKGNPRLIGWDSDRTATLTLTDALLSMESLAMLSGNAVKTGATTVPGRQVLKVATNKVTLAQTPIAGSVTVFNAAGVEVTGHTLSTKDVTLTSATPAVANGEEITVYYSYTSGANTKTVTISSDKFPGYYKLVGDTLVVDEATGEQVPYKYVAEKVKLQPGFTLTMQAEGDATTLDLVFEAFKPADGTDMIKMHLLADE